MADVRFKVEKQQSGDYLVYDGEKKLSRTNTIAEAEAVIAHLLNPVVVGYDANGKVVGETAGAKVARADEAKAAEAKAAAEKAKAEKKANAA